MYLKHFELRDKPFKLTQDLSYYYGPPLQVVLNELSYSIEENLGIALLIGEAGLGKTTVLKRLAASLPPNLKGIIMSDNSLAGQSLLDHLSALLAIRIPKGQKHFLASHLQNFARRNQKLVLLIDEAQGLADPQLEEIRYLSNLEFRGEKLIEIVLAGLPILRTRLRRPEMSALWQRIAVHSKVEPLDLEHTGNYIRHRLSIASSPDTELFTSDAIRAVYEKTQGVPRLVNILCDRVLLVAFAREALRVKPDMVEAAAADLELQERELGEEGESEGDSRPAELGLLARLLERMDDLEKKQEQILDVLEKLRSESKQPDAGASQRRWLQRIRGE
jgi:general secretion pathway protein A